VDRAYLGKMYRPKQVSTSIVEGDGLRVLRLELPPPSAAGEEGAPGFRAPRFSDEPAVTPLVPDHGKLMHLFLVGEAPPAPFAHLHPSSEDAIVFQSVLPPLPPGGYRVFADVVHEDGLAETLTGRVDLAQRGQASAAASALRPDADDSSSSAAPSGATQRLEDGSTMTFEGDGRFRTGDLGALRFTVRAADGSPAAWEPYMGMRAHAAVLRDDGSVFVHLHPVGTVAMASQEAFARRSGEATAVDHAGHGAGPSGVSFPYAFPRPGRYRLFVQIKREGRVLTGSFEASVS
jgi:hypothetical protein